MRASFVQAASTMFAVVAVLAIVVAVLSFSGVTQADEPMNNEACSCGPDTDDCENDGGSQCVIGTYCTNCNCCYDGDPSVGYFCYGGECP
jgi:hypothetical protein